MIKFYLDAILYSLMVGIGETYFVAYSLDLGHSELLSGLLATMPMVIGGIFQLFAPTFINLFKSYKGWTVFGALMQALTFTPLFFDIPLLKESYGFLFLMVSLYWSFNLGIGPSWNAWISELIPKDELNHFFTRRNFFISFGSLFGLFAGGVLLQYGTKYFGGLKVFQVLFFISFILRTSSSIILTTHPLTKFVKGSLKPFNKDYFAFPNEYDFLKKVTVFIIIFKFGVFFSAGFFSPYMLSTLKMSYIEYMFIMGAAFFGRMLFNLLIKKHMHRFSLTKLLFISSIGICIIPVVWTFYSDFAFLFILEIFTGILWGGFELAFILISFREAPTNFQSFYVSYFSFFHVIIGSIGVMLGAFVFNHFKAYEDIYYLIFIISAVMRTVSLTFFPGFKDIKFSGKIRLYYRIWAIRPNVGWIQRPSISLLSKIVKRNAKFKPIEKQEVNPPIIND